MEIDVDISRDEADYATDDQDDQDDLEENASSIEDQQASSEDEVTPPAHAYASLLRALKPSNVDRDRPAKRRKLENGVTGVDPGAQRQRVGSDPQTKEETIVGTHEAAALAEEVEDELEVGEEDSDDETFVLQDPFEKHYASVAEAELTAAIENLSGTGTISRTIVDNHVRKIRTSYNRDSAPSNSETTAKGMKLKQRLAKVGKTLTDTLQLEELDMLHESLNYQDIIYGCRSVQNSGALRDVSALHILNHIFKTRDKVLKNNARLAQETAADTEYRDQGFTRPKVLVLIPTKQACVRFIDTIVKLSEPDQQENRNRFMDTFFLPEDDTFQNKPEDFRELFSGNHEEDFRVGLKFTRKTIKFFSGFYNSDIILGSPLGLMRTITTGGGKKDSKKGHDADFLSSIEIVIVDHANALEMQNWQHVDYVFSQLNQLPKESHGCDFARARNWYLDGKAKYLRQTIILSDYITPSISALASTYLLNVAGRIRYTPTYPGTMLNVSPSIPFPITQSFLRFESPSPQTDSDARFKFFLSTVLTSLLRSSNKAVNKGTTIFVPTYLDFVRLRNHFSTAAETTSLSFGTISEYSTKGEVARARSHFLSGRHSVLLYSERAHHYFRYKLRGVRRLIFYGVPENPIFWTEMVDALGENAQSDLEWAQNQKGKQGKGLVRALFSKWDFMKLERIVGTERVKRLVSEREGDVFDFV